MSCPHAASCPLYGQFQLQSLAKYWIVQYCESPDYARCARYKLAATGQRPPLTLLPNGKMLASGAGK